MARRRGFGFWFAIVASALVAVIIAALLIWRDHILEAFLDPQVPFAVYKPPPAPDYARASAWAMLPGPADRAAAPVDVFFVHPTTFDGGKDWNGPIHDHEAQAVFSRVMAPNYAAPFARVGRIVAPRYRQASLYTSLTLFDDAIQAREFAYGDVRAAFEYFRDHLSGGRPFIVVGVEQGGSLAARLVTEQIAPDPDLRRRLVAAYLIDTIVPADEFGARARVPACVAPDQAGCVAAWASVREGDFARAFSLFTRSKVWEDNGHLVSLGGRPPLCFNPLLGASDDDDAPARLNRGAANATGLEWGARPGFMVRQVGAQCESGLLHVTWPRSASLRPSGSWAERLRVPGYNLFWADLEVDAQRRAAAWLAAPPLNPTH